VHDRIVVLKDLFVSLFSDGYGMDGPETDLFNSLFSFVFPASSPAIPSFLFPFSGLCVIDNRGSRPPIGRQIRTTTGGGRRTTAIQKKHQMSEENEEKMTLPKNGEEEERR
jgi:hypothetical protein